MPPGQRKSKKPPAVVPGTQLTPEPLTNLIREQVQVEETRPPEPPAKKTKTKKPIKVVAVVTPDGIEGSFSQEPRRPLIAHLPIHTNDIVFNETPMSSEPEPYNPVAGNMFAGDLDIIQTPVHDVKQADETKQIYEAVPVAIVTKDESRAMQCFAKVQLMVTFSETSKAKKLPDHVDIACFWCSHTFEGQPCIIPEREVAGVYNVYGNFCSPQCGLAYVLNETIDPHVRWERIALLHRIYDREGKGRMFPAPGREVLKLFGGPLTIESYRATVNQGKVRVDTHMPPMVSILGSIDTKPIDFFESSMKNTLIGSLQQEKTSRAEEGLRLKRSKPLKDRDSTLDSVMNIHIKRGVKA